MRLLKILIILIVVLCSDLSKAQSIVYPKNNQVLSDTNITLQWDETINADFYQIQIATDSLFQNLIADSITNSLSLNLNLNLNPYYFKIRSSTQSQFAPWSNSNHFIVFNPKSVDSLVLWLAADTGIIKDASNKVSQWNDLSGLGHNAWQITASKQPLFQDSILGNMPSISFISGNYIISGQYSQIKPNNRNRSLFMLLDNQYQSGLNDVFMNYDYGNYSYKYWETSLYAYQIRLWLGDGSSYNLKNLSGDYSGIKVSTIRIVNSSINTLINGIQTNQSQSSLFVDSVSNYAIGGRTSTGQNISNPFNGQVFEIIDYAKPLDSAEIQLVNKYLLDKYTPPINLGQNILRKYGFCDTTLRTTEMYESYTWSTGDTTRDISIAKQDTGWYWCEVPNLYGDIMRDSVYVYDLIGNPNLRDTTICFGDSSFISLPESLQPSASSLQPRYTYLWKNSQGQIVSTDSVLQTTLQDTYSLKISDTLGCFISDTVQVLVDSFEVQATLGPDKSLCTGDKIGLIVGQEQVDSFLWSDNTTDSLLVVQTAGTYSLIVSDTLGCIAKDTINIAIHGITPYVAFSADTVCFRDSTFFIDSSMSLDQSNLINWKWEFGDGSSIQHPVPGIQNHLYPDSGQYTVRLTVSTDSNCSNYAYKNIYIRPLPKPDFYPLTGCQNIDLQFQNLTTHKDTIVLWHWDFGDTTYSNLETPIKSFSHYSIHPVLLRATDKHGCKDSIYKPVDIKPSPNANFSYSNVCDGEPVSFADQSQTLPYNPIMSYEWNFDGSLSGAETPQHTFPSAGIHHTMLKVTALNACYDTITLPVKVNAIPQAGFTWNNACAGSPMQFVDTSVVSLDTINSWHWVFDHGWFLSTVEGPQITFNDTLTHHATLRVKSKAGCEDSTSQTFKINPSPTAAFTLDREYGLPPLTVNFDNHSTPNTKYQTLNNEWQFGDGGYSTQENPTHLYTDSSIFYPQLIVENTHGCKDSISHPVYVIYAAVDIALTEVVSNIDNGFARFSCVIENRGQQKIKTIDLTANYNGGLPIQEQWSGELLPGAKTHYVFQAKIKVNGSPAYYCITATPLNTDIEDENPADNKRCKEYQAKLWISNIYPNPASSSIHIDVILPVNDGISIQLINSDGNQIQSTKTIGKRGLNQLKINTNTLSSGTYLLRIESGVEGVVRTFIIL